MPGIPLAVDERVVAVKRFCAVVDEITLDLHLQKKLLLRFSRGRQDHQKPSFPFLPNSFQGGPIQLRRRDVHSLLLSKLIKFRQILGQGKGDGAHAIGQ